MAEQLIVLKFPRGWSIFCRGEWRGRFDEQMDAVNAALRLLGDIDRIGEGEGAQVIVQDHCGELRAYAGAPGRYPPGYAHELRSNA